MRKLVIGDIHGCYLGLLQILERANVTREDKLIFLGDYVDGWSQSYEVIEKLIQLSKNNECVFIKGNHDEWLNDFIRTEIHGSNWQQGAQATRESYSKLQGLFIPLEHEIFLRNLRNYYKDEDNNIFVHGGFNRHELLNEQHFSYIYYWDRDLWLQALSAKNVLDAQKGEGTLRFNIKEKCKEIFIGHTATINWKTDKPMNAANIWNLDTGAGFKGKVTIMDIDTKEYWQSDLVKELYPNEIGR